MRWGDLKNSCIQNDFYAYCAYATFKMVFWLLFAVSESRLQGSAIPDKVLSHFGNNYPASPHVDYDKEVDSYEVEFRLNDVKWEACYDPCEK